MLFLLAAACSVHDLYTSLPQEAAASLSGVAGAAQLKQAGYTALAVQAGAPDGAISMWDLKLAGFLPGSGPRAAAAASGSSNGSSENRHRSRSRSFNGGLAAGTVASNAQQAGGCNSGSSTVDDKLQQQQQQLLRADGPGDVEYFRQQVQPLMQMEPGNDLPDLLIGTKVSNDDRQVRAL
jgi:hypothetical protein